MIAAPSSDPASSLPVGVVLPTFNVLDRLGAHLRHLQSWIAAVQEVVVVDSHSTDGSLELIREQLHHPRLRILEHPRGLYQSWNHGIGHITAPYTYISTIGETITPFGLSHLVATASRLEADVVLSRPNFFNEQGRPVPKQWPIHDFFEARPMSEPDLLNARDVFFLAALDVPESIAGSAASNLYRTATLQKHPFFTDYGHLGDEAWFIAHAFDVAVAVTPQVFSTFMVHPSGNRMPGEVLNELVKRLRALSEETLTQAAERVPGVNAETLRLALREFAGVRLRLGLCQERLARARTGWWPWVLNPPAWSARWQRNQLRVQLPKTNAWLNVQLAPLSRSRPAPPSETGAPPDETGLAVSVFVCTHNPRPDYLRQVLEALRAQTLPPARWELRLVDNASAPALDAQYDISWHPRGRMLREETVGKVNALRLAFAETCAPLIAIVDDDNVVAPDFLENAVAIARRHPALGVWGGAVDLQFERPPEEWTRKYWPFLAEQQVPQDMVLPALKFSGPLPVGAGCCIRREVMRHYFRQIEMSAWRQKLGRTGASLISGEDTDMVLTAGDMGMGCGFFKALRMKHLIPPSRLTEDYLARLVEGIQFSIYILRMTRDPLDGPPEVNLKWRVKYHCAQAFKFGRRRRFFAASKQAQRKAREVYDSLYPPR
jgi:glycosyltransferase involved in cell wall biosynthesis